jgi:hypothetical protein
VHQGNTSSSVSCATWNTAQRNDICNAHEEGKKTEGWKLLLGSFHVVATRIPNDNGLCLTSVKYNIFRQH